MKICHISTVHPAFDDRIFYKECTTLTQEGFEVYLIVTHDKQEVINNVNIVPLSMQKGRLNRFLFKRFEALRKALKIKADIYHFHDPELIFVGGILKILGKKVVYDVHEDVPLQILNKEWLGSLATRKVISSIFNSVEKFLAKRYDAVVTVTTGIVEKFSINKNTILLRNFPILSLIKKAEVTGRIKDKPVMIYAGGLTRIRGIKELVQTVEVLNGSMELWLLGEWESKEFEQECSSLSGWKYTSYIGLKPMEEVYSYMKKSDVGMCTLHPTKNHLTSLPVKAFEYMACELPIIMSDFSFWMEEFEDNAVFVDPKSPKQIAKAAQNIIENINSAKEIKEKNKKLVEMRYSWEAESKSLIELYKKIFN